MSKRNHLSKKKSKQLSSHFGISDGDKIDKETGLIEELHVITVLLTDMKNEFFLHRMEMELEERNYETQLLRWGELENITDSLLEKLSHYEFDLSLLEGVGIESNYTDLYRYLIECDELLTVISLKIHSGICRNSKRHLQTSRLKELMDLMDQSLEEKMDCFISIDQIFLNNFNMLLYKLNQINFTIHRMEFVIYHYKPNNKYLIKQILYYREELISYLLYMTLLFEKYMTKLMERRKIRNVGKRNYNELE